MVRPGSRLLRGVELACLVGGLVALAAFAGMRLRGEQAEATARAAVDQSLWSESRIAKYRESLSQTFAAPLAVLRIPRIGLEVPVLQGTDDPTLDRAVGHIVGTADPGEPGNVAIAGHRDGFFRGLKDLQVGDMLELETLGGHELYAVERLEVVEPTDVGVLAPTPERVLTLVTCYPFYYVGKAPQRFIVRATSRSVAARGGSR